MKNKDKLDEPVVAVCWECEVEKDLTFRKLKNKWPHCPKCNQPMRIRKTDAIPAVHTTD